MKITNNYNLPQSLVAAAENDPYMGTGDISTTRLIAPYQIVALQKKYAPELSEDVSDRIYSLIGQNTHHIIERVNVPGTVKEWRFFLNVADWILSGQIDLWEDGVLSDWKVTSMWAYINGLKPEHEAQMNVNAFLIRHSIYSNSLHINKMQIVNIFRDWSKIKAMRDKSYPQSQVGIQNVPDWGSQRTWDYISDRILHHQACEHLNDNELPECTTSERWEKPTKYAVMKKGRKSALRVLDSQEDAEKWVQDNNLANNSQTYIDIRPGESTRCEYYCNVKDFCSQHKRIRGE